MDPIVEAIKSISDALKNQNSFNWVYFAFTTLLPLAISIGAFIFTLGTRKIDQKILRQSRFDNLMNEYRSNEMHEKLKYIWIAFKAQKKNAKVQSVDEIHSQDVLFLLMLKDEKANAARRYLTHFFALFAKYYLAHKIDQKEVKSLWGEDNLKIITEILIPFEKAHLRKTFEQDETKIEKNITLNNLDKFYNSITER